MNANLPIRALLGNGSIEAEVEHRLQDAIAKAGDPATWTPTTDARMQMAVRVALKAIHDELEARPGITYDESVALDALLGQPWVNAVLTYVRIIRGGDA